MFEIVERPAARKLSIAQLLDDLRQDLHYALRQLRRAPAFAALVIATLAIGIGANATMVGVIDRLLFRAPPGLADPGNLNRLLINFFRADGQPGFGTAVDYPTYIDLKASVPALSELASYMRVARLPLVSDDPAAEVGVSLVSANYFQTLGVRPLRGSFFTTKDGFPTTARMGGPTLAVVSYAFWQRQFGGSASALGRAITIGKLTYNIVGVTPPGFHGVDSDAPDVWVPVTAALEIEFPMRYIAARDGPYMQMVGRLASGASRQQVEAQGTVTYRAIDALQRSKSDSSRLPNFVPAPIVAARGPDAPREVKITLWLGGVSALVLLIVCANVANLLLGRAFTRRREIAVRLALGAGRGRLARQLLAEALLLSIIGGACGLLMAVIGGRLLQQLLIADVSNTAIVDARLFLFAAAISVGTGLLVSLIPMMQSTTPDLSNGLRASTSNSATRIISVRSVLLATQAALCVVLLIGAGLFAQSLRRVQRLDLGVSLDHTLQISLTGVGNLAINSTAAFALTEEIKRKVLELPGVRSAGLTQSLFGGGRASPIHTPDRTFDEVFPPGSWNEAMYESGVDSGMFRTLGVRSLRGRDFTSADRAGERRVVILNAPLANRIFPGGDALGKCVVMPVYGSDASKTECVEVVGVLSGYYRRSIIDRDGMVAYIPLAQQTMRTPATLLYASTIGDANAMAETVRKAVLSVRPDLRRLVVKSMRSVIEPEMRPWNLAANLFVLFGAVALLIASIGLYAVVSFSVAQRTTEIAVRLALGARTRHIGSVVGTGSLYAVSAGLGIGVLVAILLRNSIGPLLFQTSPNDPLIIGGVVALLLSVAVVAMIVPLVRALRVNPSEVMRSA